MKMIFLFIAGIVIGIGASVASIGPPEPPYDDTKLYSIINQYKDMIARDDRIINFFTHVNWDRDDCIRQEPEQLLADGTWLISVQVVPCDGTK